MEFIEKTKRFYRFKSPTDLKFMFNGIKSDGDVIQFPTKSGQYKDDFRFLSFGSPTECTQFYQKLEEMIMNEFKSMERIDKSFVNVNNKSLTMTDSE